MIFPQYPTNRGYRYPQPTPTVETLLSQSYEKSRWASQWPNAKNPTTSLSGDFYKATFGWLFFHLRCNGIRCSRNRLHHSDSTRPAGSHRAVETVEVTKPRYVGPAPGGARCRFGNSDFTLTVPVGLRPINRVGELPVLLLRSLSSSPPLHRLCRWLLRPLMTSRASSSPSPLHASRKISRGKGRAPSSHSRQFYAA